MLIASKLELENAAQQLAGHDPVLSPIISRAGLVESEPPIEIDNAPKV